MLMCKHAFIDELAFLSAFHYLHLNNIMLLNLYHLNISCTSYTAICTPACMNGGTCSSPGVCTCTSDWSGVRCGDRELLKLNSTLY